MPSDYDVQSNLEQKNMKIIKRFWASKDFVFLGKNVPWFLQVLYPLAHDSGDRSE